MTLHDILFKSTFEHPGAAHSVIRAALPPDILDEIDFTTLEVVPGSFLRDRLRQRFVDLLLRARMRGMSVYLHFLFEHKSRPERFTVIDLFDSVGGIWRDWISKHAAERFVPRVLPIVFHHGHAAWDQPRELRELFGGNTIETPAVARFDPLLPVLFVDLGGSKDPESKCESFQDPVARCAVYLLMISRMRDFLTRMVDHGLALLAPAWNSRRGTTWARTVLEYIDACLPESAEIQEFVTMIGDRIHPEAEREFRTLREVTNERMRAEGRREGLREGLAQGIEKGIEKGIARGLVLGEVQAITVVLRSRFGAAADELVARFDRVEDPELLSRLLAAAAVAPALPDLMSRFEAILDET